MVTFFKNLFVIAIIIAGLTGIGLLLKALIPWEYLTILFTLVRQLPLIFSFMWDMDSMFELIGKALYIETVVWSFYALYFIIKSSGLNKT